MKAFSISLVLFIARICIAAIFILAASSKFIDYDQTIQYMTAKGLPAVPLLLVLAALAELVGGLSLLFGYKTRFGATVLLLFLIPTTYLFHDFWNVTGEGQPLQQIMFFKNLAIFGGLLYVLCHGAGWFSCDSYHRRHHKEVEPATPAPVQKP